MVLPTSAFLFVVLIRNILIVFYYFIDTLFEHFHCGFIIYAADYRIPDDIAAAIHQICSRERSDAVCKIQGVT